MIDPHHRYGSHLKAYHTYWLKHTDNKDNFFHWLDEGDGLKVDLADQGRSRHALDTEKVRYLTREERAKYLVKIDEKGLLRWAKNDELIDTALEYRDSLEGIVKVTDERAPPVPAGEETLVRSSTESSDTSSTSGSSAISGTERADRYINQKAGVKKIFLISPQAVMNRLLRKTTRKNTWIYVTDTSYRLYVGLKQSGSFQHSVRSSSDLANLVLSSWVSCDIRWVDYSSPWSTAKTIAIVGALSLFDQTLQIFPTCHGATRGRYVKGAYFAELYDNGITYLCSF